MGTNALRLALGEGNEVQQTGIIYLDRKLYALGEGGQPSVDDLRSQEFGVTATAAAFLKGEDYRSSLLAESTPFTVVIAKGARLDRKYVENKVHTPTACLMAGDERVPVNDPPAELATLLLCNLKQKDFENMGVTRLVIMHVPFLYNGLYRLLTVYMNNAETVPGLGIAGAYSVSQFERQTGLVFVSRDI